QCFAFQTELKSQIFLQPVDICLNAWEYGQKCFDFRCEIKDLVDDCIIKRFDAKPITGTEEFFLFFIPQSKGKHATQMLNTVRSPFSIGVEDHFCIGTAGKAFLTQFSAEFDI